jgi:hypothetical protein
MFKIKFTIFVLFVFITAANYGQNQPKDFDYGKVENNRYVNSYFAFEIPVPADWFIQSKEKTENMAQLGKDMVAGDDAKMKAVFKASEINTALLLTVFKYEPGSPVEYNPCISLLAENISTYPGIKTGSDYLYQASRILAQSQIKYDYIDKNFEKEVISGTDFYTMHTEMNYLGVRIKQIYFSTIIKGFSFDVIISYVNDEQKKELLSLTNAMKFSN